MSKKPGVMIYFDIRGSLEFLSDEECGTLFRAIMEYGETGKPIEQKLSGRTKVLWPLIQATLDHDNERYWEVSVRNRYANYVRWQREKGEEVLSRSQWEALYNIPPVDMYEED